MRIHRLLTNRIILSPLNTSACRVLKRAPPLWVHCRNMRPTSLGRSQHVRNHAALLPSLMLKATATNTCAVVLQVTASSICCQNLSTSITQAFGAKTAAQWA